MKRIGIVYFADAEGVPALHSQIARRLGYEPVDFLWNARLPDHLDMVFMFGPWGSITPLANQLIAIPAERRPKLVWWLSEQLPNPSLPEWLRRVGGRLRSRMERWAYIQQTDGSWSLRKGAGKLLTAKAIRFRYYGDLLWLNGTGTLSLLVQGSELSNRQFNSRGFPVYFPPIPSHFPEWGADLKLERDIPVLWLGKNGTARRRRLLDRIERELGVLGIPLLRIDGERHPYVFGDERTRLLNRTKIVLNVLREAWDNNAMRFHLAALNRALVVSEPLAAHTAFNHLEHLVIAPIQEIPARIQHYLQHEDERQAITEQAYQLISRFKREDAIAQIIDRVFSAET